MKSRNKLLTLLILSAGATAATAVINKCIKLSSVSKNLLEESKSLCYKWRFGNIHYTKTGHGQPLLLVHDLNAISSGYEWSQLIEQLKRTYTLYVIDLLGCGRSEKPDLTYTNFLYVQLISDFIKSEIGHRTDIIATGGSSSVAIMACYHTPELFDRIMLLSPESLLNCSQIPGKHAKLYKFFLDLPVAGTLLYYIATSKKAILEELLNKYFYNPYSIKGQLIDSYHEAAHLGHSPKSFYASVKCNYTKCNITNALKKIDNSIYIAAGTGMDHLEGVLKEYKECNSAIETSVIPNAKGLPQIENPGELLNVIFMFFS